jgi:hypothetical protein
MLYTNKTNKIIQMKVTQPKFKNVKPNDDLMKQFKCPRGPLT